MSFNRDNFKQIYPFRSNYLNRKGLLYHYLDEGSGEPLVMVHGNPTWSFYYRHLVSKFRGSHRVVVPDHIGCGLSDKPNDKEYSYYLQNRVDDLEALIDHLELDQITLVLHDWGGMIGMAYAVKYPEKIKRLVILNTAAFFLPKDKKLPFRLKLVRNYSFLTAPMVRGLNLFNLTAVYMASKKGLKAEVKKGLLAPYDSWSNRRAILRFVQDIPLSETDQSYELVKEVEEKLHIFNHHPMLICWGMGDFVFDVDFLEEWKRRFPSAAVKTYHNAGHYVLEDEPDRIAEDMGNFIGLYQNPGQL